MNNLLVRLENKTILRLVSIDLKHHSLLKWKQTCAASYFK